MEEKSTKKLFQEKKHPSEKKHKKTLLFFKNTCWEDCKLNIAKVAGVNDLTLKCFVHDEVFGGYSSDKLGQTNVTQMG